MLDDTPVPMRTHVTCPMCAGHVRRRYDRVRDRLGTSSVPYQVDECIGCGLGMINPAPTGDLSRFYPENYLSQEGSGEEERGVPETDANTAGLLSRAERAYRYDQYRFDFGLMRRAVNTDISDAKSYVDVGCGSGERVSFAREQGCERAMGIDRYRFGKRTAWLGVELINAEITDFRPEERFQVASMFHVLEHVEDPIGILRHLRNAVLADDGVLIVQVPNYGSIERRIFGRRWFGLDAPRHLFQFDSTTARRALQDAGFEVVAVFQVNAPLHPVTLVPSVFPALDVQRIWVRPGGTWSKLAAQALWALATVVAIPFALLQNMLRRASMLTVVARPRPR